MTEYRSWISHLNDFLLGGINRDDCGTSISFLMLEKDFSSNRFQNILSELRSNGFSFQNKVGRYISPVGCFNFDKKIHAEISFPELEINDSLFEKYQSIVFGPWPFFLRFDKSIGLIVISVWVDEKKLLGHPNLFDNWVKIARIVSDNFPFIIGFQWGNCGSLHKHKFNLKRLVDFFKNPVDNFFGDENLSRFYFPMMFWGNELLTGRIKDKVLHAPVDQQIRTKNGIGLIFIKPESYSEGIALDLKNYFEYD